MIPGPDPIPVLTLWQPWASLVALGVKSIETRSWSTEYRGPLAIHAAARKPEPGDIAPWHVWNESGYVWWLDGRDGDPESSNYFWLPLGAIVTTATLVDVVPILPYSHDQSRCRPHVMGYDDGAAFWLNRADGSSVSLTDQRPYGDFTPGRFAWLLADVEPVDPPVHFKGGQRLTRKWAP